MNVTLVDEQILFGLLIAPPEDLGFVTFDVPHWQLVNGLGQGKFSTVAVFRPM